MGKRKSGASDKGAKASKQVKGATCESEIVAKITQWLLDKYACSKSKGMTCMFKESLAKCCVHRSSFLGLNLRLTEKVFAVGGPDRYLSKIYPTQDGFTFNNVVTDSKQIQIHQVGLRRICVNLQPGLTTIVQLTQSYLMACDEHVEVDGMFHFIRK